MRNTYVLLLVCLAMPVSAAARPLQATVAQKGLLAALDRAEAVFNQFEQTTARINFKAWKAPAALVNSADEMLERTNKQIAEGRAALATLRKPWAPSPVDMFLVLEALHAATVAGNLGQDVGELAHDYQLAGDLLSATEAANLRIEEIKQIFSTMLLDRERELLGCKGGPDHHP